jgi:hypothetical protein
MASVQLLVVVAVLCVMCTTAFKIPGAVALRPRSRVNVASTASNDAYTALKDKVWCNDFATAIETCPSLKG